MGFTEQQRDNMFLKRGFGLLARQAKAVAATEGAANPFQQQALLALGTTQVQARTIGSWIPEFWGKKSKYTEGTEFLGTPENHLELIKKRPISPDVFSIDQVGMHYKMPVAALSSITNRVTGVAMTGGMLGLATVSLGGDALGAIDAAKAGVRHLVWDTYHIGNQTEKSLLDKEQVEKSSNA